MKNLKEKLAKKMLDEKITFLSVEDTLELLKENQDLKSETDLSYVYNCEELEEENDSFTTLENLENDENFFGFEIGDSHDHFDEFTRSICPVFTYIDLIRE